MKFTYKTEKVCSREISFEINNGIISNISFKGGCNGNLKALSKVLEGMPAEFVIERLEGNKCETKTTSCADQLAQAVKSALKETE